MQMIIDEVLVAVSKWDVFAKQAEIPETKIKEDYLNFNLFR